jgi:hypothetical protein
MAESTTSKDQASVADHNIQTFSVTRRHMTGLTTALNT